MNHNSIWKVATENVELLTSHFYQKSYKNPQRYVFISVNYFALGSASDFFI